MFNDVFVSYYKTVDGIEVLPNKQLAKAVKALGFHSADIRKMTGRANKNILSHAEYFSSENWYSRLTLPGDAGIDLEVSKLVCVGKLPRFRVQAFQTLGGILVAHEEGERREEIDIFDAVDVDGDG